jgi:hypothetical protein
VCPKPRARTWRVPSCGRLRQFFFVDVPCQCVEVGSCFKRCVCRVPRCLVACFRSPFPSALACWAQAAARSHADAMCCLGAVSYHGLCGQPVDHAAAFAWYDPFSTYMPNSDITLLDPVVESIFLSGCETAPHPSSLEHTYDLTCACNCHGLFLCSSTGTSARRTRPSSAAPRCQPPRAPLGPAEGPQAGSRGARSVRSSRSFRRRRPKTRAAEAEAAKAVGRAGRAGRQRCIGRHGPTWRACTP